MIRELSKPYVSRHGTPTLTRVETDIFIKTYFTYCLKCTFCNDACCAHGVDVARDEVRQLDQHVEALEQYTGVRREDWFIETYEEDDDFPGRGNTRTSTRRRGCVFLNPAGRSCMIHAFCLQNGMDYHALKPMICCLFPVTFGNGLLAPSDEVDDQTLICLNQGPSLYAGVRDELRYYFGQEFISELEALEAACLAERKLANG